MTAHILSHFTILEKLFLNLPQDQISQKKQAENKIIIATLKIN